MEGGGFLISNQQQICGLVLVAGLSSRMGDFKPLMPFRGKTMMENTVDSILNGGARSVVTVTGYRRTEVETVLQRSYGDRVVLAHNPDFTKTDMLHSIQIGCRHMPHCDAFFLLPGDMPVVCQSTFQKLLKARLPAKPGVVFPTLDGFRKHPPLIDARLIPRIIAFSGNGGLRRLWEQLEDLIVTVPVDDVGICMDLDTQPEYQLCKQTYELEK